MIKRIKAWWGKHSDLSCWVTTGRSRYTVVSEAYGHLWYNHESEEMDLTSGEFCWRKNHYCGALYVSYASRLSSYDGTIFDPKTSYQPGDIVVTGTRHRVKLDG